MVRMSKNLYVGVFTATFTLALLSFIPVMGLMVFTPGSVWLHETFGTETWQTMNIVIVSLAVLAVSLFLSAQVVMTFVLLYKMWASIQDGQARTTPGKAIGLLLIPFFCVYWIFQVWGGFPADYNSYVERNRLGLPRLESGVYAAYPVLILLSVVPFLNIITVSVSLFVFFVITTKTCDAVNRLADATQEQNRFVPPLNASSGRVVA